MLVKCFTYFIFYLPLVVLVSFHSKHYIHIRDCSLIMAKRGPVFISMKGTVKNAPS